MSLRLIVLRLCYFYLIRLESTHRHRRGDSLSCRAEENQTRDYSRSFIDLILIAKLLLGRKILSQLIEIQV